MHGSVCCWEAPPKVPSIRRFPDAFAGSAQSSLTALCPSAKKCRTDPKGIRQPCMWNAKAYNHPQSAANVAKSASYLHHLDWIAVW